MTVEKFTHEGDTYNVEIVETTPGCGSFIRFWGPDDWKGKSGMTAVYDLGKGKWTYTPTANRYSYSARRTKFMDAANTFVGIVEQFLNI